MNIKGIVIFKTQGESIFEVGQKLIREGKETDIVVTNIDVDFLGHVKISLSNGKAIYYKNCPITYEK